MPSLVIVDVQKEFSAAKYVLPQVLKLIKEFKEKKLPIIVLEYGNYAREEEVLYYDTYKAIMANLTGYPFFKYKFKWIDCGSAEVIQSLRELNYNSKKITICGVNTSACVAETVEGLIQAKYKINVIKKACHDKESHYHNRQMKRWKNYPEVSVI